MPRLLPFWRKRLLPLVAWGFCFAVLASLTSNSVLAQEHGVVEEVVPQQEDFVWDLLRNLFDSQKLMQTLGDPRFTVAAFIALNVIVFVETGLLIGFFLPGDSLLVITGMITSSPTCGWSLPLLLGTLSLSAIAGDTVGYWIGFKTGPKIFKREKSLFFNKDHLLKAQQFYEVHGGKTIILARFMPILRTFAPVVAGVGRMEYHRFLFYNIFGGISWVFSMILAGRFLPALLDPLLQSIFGPDFHIVHHVEKVVIIVVLLSIAPGVIAWINNRLTSKVDPAGEAPAPSPSDPALHSIVAK